MWYLHPMNSALAKTCARQTSLFSGNLSLFSSMNLFLSAQWCEGSCGLRYLSTSHEVSGGGADCSEDILGKQECYRTKEETETKLGVRRPKKSVGAHSWLAWGLGTLFFS